MTIHVTRHGQSMTNIDADLNSGFKINTRNNILTETGIKQAIEFGHHLKNDCEPIEAIICSPYARTKQTAFTIASVLGTCVPIFYDRAFREIEWELNGTFSRLEKHIDGFDYSTISVDYKPLIDRKRGATSLESQQEVYERVIPAFKRTAERYAGKNILIVTHYFVVRAIMAWLYDGVSQTMTQYEPKNLCDLKIRHEEVRSRCGDEGQAQ